MIKIGIEVHCQLNTKTKLFCSCGIDWQAPPNSLVCPVCLGMPGTLPVVNKRAVEFAIKTAIALNCSIHKMSSFARKNYFYPDLPKGYQITQYDEPLATNGYIEIENKKIRIRRVHLEEDAGKLIHEKDYTLIDFNRCGVPLIEIVTEPDIESGKEAVEYLKKLRQILRYIEVSEADMEKGHMRCEPNISINGGERTEIKNLNSFKAVEKGIEYEIKRQSSLKQVRRATLLWNEKEERTEEMRTKEEAEDYRYFPEPDLPPLIISDDQIQAIKSSIGELPDNKIKRFITQYNMAKEDAKIICEEKELANFYEEVAKLCKNTTLLTNFIKREFLSLIQNVGQGFSFVKEVSPQRIAELLNLIDNNTINIHTAKKLLPEIIKVGQDFSLASLIEKKGLKQLSDKSELENLVKEVLNAHPQEVEKYRSGKKQLIGFFVGEVMRATKGKANPHIVNEILKEILK